MSSAGSTRGLAIVVGLALSTIVLSAPRAFAQFGHVQFAASRAASGFLFDSSVDRDAPSYGNRVAELQVTGRWGCYLPESITDDAVYARDSLAGIPLGLDDVTTAAAESTLAIATFNCALANRASGALDRELAAARAALAEFDDTPRWRSPLETNVDPLFTTARPTRQPLLVTLF